MGERVFLYCERGMKAGLLAEPANLASNGAFLIAAILLWQHLARAANTAPPTRRWLTALIALTAMVGVGSSIFHAVPTRGAQVLDVVPIGLLVVALLWGVLRWIFELPAPRATGLLACFVFSVGAALAIMAGLDCRPGLTPQGVKLGPCLNGSWLYVPVLAALVISAACAGAREAARSLAAAAAAFAIALLARSLDLLACRSPVWLSLHAVWHLGAAAAAYAVLRALIIAAPRR